MVPQALTFAIYITHNEIMVWDANKLREKQQQQQPTKQAKNK